MTLTTLVAWLLVSGGAVALLSSALISAALGGLLLLLGRSTLGEPVRVEALLIVSTSWLSICLLGGVPFVLGANSLRVTLFEATSGFTTTGATISESGLASAPACTSGEC